MNDDPAFDDPAFDELRALLADARASEPVPDDVAARLDATLASLQAERAAGRGSDPGTVVVPLRRRLAPRLLVAAAALVVVATGSVGILRGIGDTGGNDAATAESATTSDDAAGGSGQPAVPRSDGPAPERDGASGYASTVAELSSATFARDAARVMREAAAAAKAEAPADGDTATDTAEPFADGGADGTAPTAPPLTASSGRLDTLLRQGLEACSGPDAPGAVTLAATLDGRPAALVFRPPTESGQLVEAWSCDGTRLLASATVAR